jgi:hypothetical protein
VADEWEFEWDQCKDYMDEEDVGEWYFGTVFDLYI